MNYGSLNIAREYHKIPQNTIPQNTDYIIACISEDSVLNSAGMGTSDDVTMIIKADVQSMKFGADRRHPICSIMFQGMGRDLAKGALKGKVHLAGRLIGDSWQVLESAGYA